MKPRETDGRKESMQKTDLRVHSNVLQTRCSEAPPDHIVKTNEFAPKSEKSNAEESVAQPVTP